MIVVYTNVKMATYAIVAEFGGKITSESSTIFSVNENNLSNYDTIVFTSLGYAHTLTIYEHGDIIVSGPFAGHCLLDGELVSCEDQFGEFRGGDCLHRHKDAMKKASEMFMEYNKKKQDGEFVEIGE